MASPQVAAWKPEANLPAAHGEQAAAEDALAKRPAANMYKHAVSATGRSLGTGMCETWLAAVAGGQVRCVRKRAASAGSCKQANDEHLACETVPTEQHVELTEGLSRLDEADAAGAAR
jgi:hypothetical protein